MKNNEKIKSTIYYFPPPLKILILLINLKQPILLRTPGVENKEPGTWSRLVYSTWECTMGSTMRGRRYWMQRMMMVKVFFM